MVVKVRNMRNLANIHPISAIFGTVATAILMVAEYAVSSGRTGPPTLVEVFETFLSCDFLADGGCVARGRPAVGRR